MKWFMMAELGSTPNKKATATTADTLIFRSVAQAEGISTGLIASPVSYSKGVAL